MRFAFVLGLGKVEVLEAGPMGHVYVRRQRVGALFTSHCFSRPLKALGKPLRRAARRD